MIKIKNLLYTIAVSIGLMILLMWGIYDFDMSLMNLSNVIFVIGIILFFLGLISVTGAIQVFGSSQYLTRKTFSRKGKHDFKTFKDYRDYKQLKNAGKAKNGKGLNRLLLGSVYIIASLIIGFY